MMKVRLLRDARIKHHKGEIVEISDPLELRYLVSVGSAEPLDEVKVETPEEVKAEEEKRQAELIDIQKELEAKFDELFGTMDSDD